MTTVSAFGALATLVAGAFAGCTFERWRARRRPHEAAWTIALSMFAIASAAYWWAGAVGWNEANFRVFYLFGAILNVPYLALGTVFLLGGERRGRPVARTLHLVAAFCAGVVLAAPMNPLPSTGLPEGRATFGAGPRIMAAVGSGVGTAVLVGGALWSVWSLLRRRTRPAGAAAPAVAPGRLAATNVAVALGAGVLGVGGSLFAETEREVGFGLFLVVGVVLLFVGFLISSPSPPARRGASPGSFMAELQSIATDPEPAGRDRAA